MPFPQTTCVKNGALSLKRGFSPLKSEKTPNGDFPGTLGREPISENSIQGFKKPPLKWGFSPYYLPLKLNLTFPPPQWEISGRPLSKNLSLKRPLSLSAFFLGLNPFLLPPSFPNLLLRITPISSSLKLPGSPITFLRS